MSRTKLAFLGGICTCLLIASAWAAQAVSSEPAAFPASRPAPVQDLYQKLISPGIVVRLGAQAGVPESVIDEFRPLAQNILAKIEVARQKLITDTATLEDLVNQDSPDVKACLAQLDKVLDDEHAIKRLNLEGGLAVRSKLTPQQFAKLRQLLDESISVSRAQTDLKVKMVTVQNLAQQRQQEGRDLTEVRKLMQNVRNAYGQGHFQEADDALNQILKLLD